MVAEELNPADTADLAWLRAQTRHAVKAEMASRLEDVISRRTGALLFSRDNSALHLEALAAEMAGLLGWSARRQVEEIGRCKALVAAMFRWRE